MLLATAGLVLLSPVLLIIAAAILVTSGPPVLFAQERVGMDGRAFLLYKFRTMRRDTGGLLITASGDRRITRLGRLLRDTKMDELPQLVNVLRGQMSLVGPRPEVVRYVSIYTEDQRKVLEARPGLTDPASVMFREEESLLASVPEGDRERFYVQTVLPRKLGLNLQYIERAGLAYDVTLVLKTLCAVLRVPGA